MLGILAVVLCIVCIGPLLGIPAVICGHLALSRIKRSNGTMKGHGPAIGGLVTGYISIALIPVIGLLSAIAIPNFVKARQAAQRNACIGNLRLIDSMKQQLAQQGGGEPTKENLLRLNPNSDWPACPAGGTYEIKTVNESPTCTISDHALTP